MAKQESKPVGSLTSDLRAFGDAERIALRRATKNAANLRNKANQKAIGQWHNDSRDKKTEVPFPVRRTS